MDESTLPEPFAQAMTAGLEKMVEEFAELGFDRRAVVDLFTAFGAIVSTKARGAVATAERLRDFADQVERLQLHTAIPPKATRGER